MRYLEALASPTASAAFPGGEAALATFRARAFARIGDEQQAVAIAGTVIDNALTGEGHPEAEAYEIRARTKDRGHAQRAADLLEAGRLVGSRGGAAELRRSVALLREAADLDPTNAEIYWYWADNLRLSAYESTPPSADVLHEALDVWEQGRRLGPVDQSWPCIVEAALAEALGDAEPELRRRWAMRGLRAVLDALHRDQQASFNWSWLSRCCRRLELWATASFAMQQCETAAGDFTSHHDAELEERISLRNQTDPDGLIPAVDELESLVGPSPWSRQIRAVALLRYHDYATAIDTVGRAVEEDFSASVRLIQAYVYAMANDPRLIDVVADLEASVGAADGDDLGPLDPAWLALWRGDFDRAERLGTGAADLHKGLEVDPFESASFRLQLALLTGQGDPTPLLDEALRGITAGSLQELDIELSWVGRVLDHHGRADLSSLTDMCRTRIAALQEDLPTWAEGNAEDALTELDAHLIAGDTEEPDVAAVTAARALVSRRIGIPVTTESDWPTVLRIDLGSALIPLDADSRWEEWSLFTDLIPRCRDALRQRIGFPSMGIAIGASYLRPNEFEVHINGVSGGVREVPIELCGEEPRPLDSYTGSAPWEPPMAQLTAAVLRHPAAVFVPRTMESLLEEWRDHGSATSAALAQLESDLRLRIAVWQRLHEIVSREGRLPEWDEGLGEVLASLGLAGGADD
jgi:hypothetical protein